MPERAERARRFFISVSAEMMGIRVYGRNKQGRVKDTFGSCKSSFSQCSAVLIDRVGSQAVEGNSLYDSGVRGVSISLFT